MLYKNFLGLFIYVVFSSILNFIFHFVFITKYLYVTEEM